MLCIKLHCVFFTPQEAGITEPRVGVGSDDSLNKRRWESGHIHAGGKVVQNDREMIHTAMKDFRLAETGQEGRRKYHKREDLSVFVGRNPQGTL